MRPQRENKKFLLSCIVPVYNAQIGLAKFIQELENYIKSFTNFYEIIVVDHGSNDDTTRIVAACTKNSNIKLIQLSRNFGKAMAVAAGLEYCQGDVAIIMASDFQHPFNLLPIFLSHWQNGYDIVFGIPESRKNATKINQLFTKYFYHVGTNACDFRLLDRKVIDAINECSERSRSMPDLYAWVGFTSIGIPFKTQNSTLGNSSWNFQKLTALAITSFSNTPLRIFSLIGLLFAGTAFIFAIGIITKTVRHGIELPGYASIMVAIIFFGGIQLLSIGILGEYIARIFNEVKQRPKYVIKQKIGFK